MAKIKRKVTKKAIGSYKESREGVYDGPPPTPGRYKCKIVACTVIPKKNDPDVNQLKVTYEIFDHPKYSGAHLYDYIPLDDLTEDNEWKSIQFEIAIGALDAGKEKAQSVDWDTDDQVGKTVLVRVRADSYNGEYQAKVGSVLPFEGSDEADEADEDDEDGFDSSEDDDDEEGEKEDDDEEEDEEDEDEEEEDEEDEEESDEDEITEEEIDALDKDGIKELIKKHGLKKPKKADTVKKVKAWLKKELVNDPF